MWIIVPSTIIGCSHTEPLFSFATNVSSAIVSRKYPLLLLLLFVVLSQKVHSPLQTACRIVTVGMGGHNTSAIHIYRWFRVGFGKCLFLTAEDAYCK